MIRFCRFVSFACLIAAAGFTLPAGAAETTTEFSIAAQPLSTALIEFAKQANVQVLTAGQAVEGVGASDVAGSLTLDNALQRLLKDSGFTYRFLDKKTLILIREGETVGAAMPSGTDRDGSHAADDTGVRIAQAATDSTVAEGDARGAQIEEVVVTAQKRMERVTDVPIAISVLSGEELDRSSAQGVTEMLRRVAGISISSANLSGATSITMRGVASGGPLFNGASTVAYYVDSVPFGLVKSALLPDPNPYDLDRIEVLKGPQGDLYGANSVNGVVRVLTQDANLSEVEFKARAGTSTIEGGDYGYRGDAALNVPLIKDKFAARIVAGQEHVGGWIEKAGVEDANDADLTNVRLKLNAQPIQALSLGASVWVSRNDYGASAASDLNDQRATTTDESVDVDFNAYGLTVGYDFGAFTLSSMTSYLEYENRSAIFAGAPLGTVLDAEVFSEELLLNSASEGAWHWSAGVFYRDATDNLFQTFPGFIPAPIDFDNVTESTAVFGQLTRKLLDNRLELTAGLRYFRDEVQQNEVTPNDGDLTRPLIRRSEEFTAWTPRATLTWHPNDEGIVYASYSQGFRSGFNQNPNIARLFPTVPPLDPDRLYNYELGTKGQILGGALSYEAAVYYMDWDDIQLTVGYPVGTTFATASVNAASASGPGVDLSMTFRPVAGLGMTLSGSCNDLQIDEPVLDRNVVLFAKGDRPNFSTEYTAGASVDYTFGLGGSAFTGRIATAVNHTAAYETRNFTGGTVTVRRTNELTEGRVSFTLSARQRWEAMLFVDNVTDERGTVSRISATDHIRLRPRRAGIQLDYRF
jgi:iron complex outermembrane recepter protein